MVFTGTSRVLIPNTGMVHWLPFGVYTFPTIPKTLYPGSRLMVVHLAYAGVGCGVSFVHLWIDFLNVTYVLDYEPTKVSGHYSIGSSVMLTSNEMITASGS